MPASEYYLTDPISRRWALLESDLLRMLQLPEQPEIA